MAKLSGLEKRWNAYHRDNAGTYEKIKQYALEMILAGVPNVSMTMIVERIKWFSLVEAGDGKPFALNHDYYALYARMFCDEFPQHEDRFVFRTRRAA